MTDSAHRQADGSQRSAEPDRSAAHLAGVTPEQAQQLAAVNNTGLAALRSCLGSGQAAAFLGCRARPIPECMDVDPLARVERQVAEAGARGQDANQ